MHKLLLGCMHVHTVELHMHVEICVISYPTAEFSEVSDGIEFRVRRMQDKFSNALLSA